MKESLGCSLREKIKQLLHRQNQEGSLFWLWFTLQYLRNLWRFHPPKRFSNFCHYAYLILLRKYRPLNLDSRIANGVFYICVAGNDDTTLLMKIPRLNNIHSYSFWKRLHSSKAYSEYSKILLSLRDDPILGKHFPYVKGVRRDGGYLSSYIEGYNLLIARDILRDNTVLPLDLDPSEMIKAVDELLDSLRTFELRNGRIAGDWALHNLIYDISNKVIKNVDLEGFYMYRHGELTANIKYIEAELCFLREIVDTRMSKSPEDNNILKTLSVVAYVTKSDVAYSGKDYFSGYHSLTLGGRYFRGQRGCAARLATVPYDFACKVVLDLGCNCGGMLHCLADRILMGVGLDRDTRCINAANLIKGLNRTHNLHFFTFDLENEDLNLIDNFVLQKQVDICFILSMCMWLRNWKKVIVYASQIARTVLFETNGEAQQQREQVVFLNNCFGKIELINSESSDDPSQNARALYLCDNTTPKDRALLSSIERLV